jgi:hypothetical protein
MLPQMRVLLHLGVNVLHRNVTDVRRHTRIGQRLQRLLEVGHRRVEAGDHHAVRIPTNRLLQQGSQLAVAVGRKDVGFARGRSLVERGNHLPERKQTLVDLYPLLEHHPRRFSHLLPLTPRKVHYL